MVGRLLRLNPIRWSLSSSPPKCARMRRPACHEPMGRTETETPLKFRKTDVPYMILGGLGGHSKVG